MSTAAESVDVHRLIDAQGGAPLTTDDIVFLAVPLLRTVANLHAHGRVASLDAGEILRGVDGRLQLRTPEGRLPEMNLTAIKSVQPPPSSALNVVGQHRVTVDSAAGTTVDDYSVQDAGTKEITRPVYIPGYESWELRLGHHDELTDIFQIGQLLASLALGLDFDQAEDLKRFASRRDNLFAINQRLNPVLANILREMTALNRHDRATELGELANRLETWRDQPVGLEVERVLAGNTGVASRRGAVLSHLRDRLFDLTRRNRLLHFRPTQASVNLTVASVPLVLQLESIRADQLCTWGGKFADAVTSGKAVNLQQWLRFEDQPYLPGSLDRIIQETRRDSAEFGFSHLRLVLGFLRWNNLKESPDERIVSPLLWLPVQLSKRKGVRDQYVLQCEDAEAEFNPALRHYLRQLYDVRLPEFIDLETTTLEQVHADLQAQIQKTEPGVELRLVTQPEIELIHQKAVQRMQVFQRRRRMSEQRATGVRPDFSYDAEDFRPLGLAMFRQKVMPSPLPLRSAVGAAPVPRPTYMATSAGEAERLTYSLGNDRGNRFAWDLDLTQVTLANFNYKKMSLVRDYSQLIDEGTPNPALDRVFSIEPRAVETETPPAIPLADQWNVVSSDATQNAAVSLARSGRSFIIQGPPGTGKSQTITNLIADYIGRGKRVLFVCEKRAALDVVFHRLKQSGLADLCCLIHDSQTDKKAFVADLRGCYEAWIGRGDDLNGLRQDRGGTLERLSTHLQRIEAFDRAMAAQPSALASSVRELFRRAIELPAAPNLDPAMRERVPDLRAWDEQRELTTKVERFLRERFNGAPLASHPFAKLSPALAASDRAYAETKALLDECDAILDELDRAFDASDRLIESNLPIAEAHGLAEACAQLTALKLADKLDLLDPGSSAASTLAAERAQLQSRQAEATQAAEATTHWREKLTPGDTDDALAQARAMEPSFFRWFQPAWYRLRGEIARRYDFGKHAVRPTLAKVLGALATEHAQLRELAQARQALLAKYGVSELEAFFRSVDEIGAGMASKPAMRKLRDALRAASDPRALAAAEAASLPPVARLHELATGKLGALTGLSFDALGEWSRDLRENLDELPDFLPVLRAVHQAGTSYANALLSLPLSGQDLEAFVVSEAIARVLRAEPQLAGFDGRTLARAGKSVARGEKVLLEQNAKVASATIHHQFLHNVRRSAMSVTQLDEAAKEFKKHYSTGRRELEHEFGKTMRHSSIREFADGDSGMVINDLKPVWLMSPLSVSDTLPLIPELFDVVIFDEASQIPMEEAVPALCRANQVVVVGDEMQLPPTSFFSATGDEEDEQVVLEEEGTKIAINLDADSLLNQAARNLPATLLAWHYRSRHESLISFSNAAFYDGRLVTIPDRKLEGVGAGILPVRSDAPEAAAEGAAVIAERAISFHKVGDGVYVDRRNVPEARYIARLVRELLREEDGMSLGLVAFSEAQQTEIEDALEALAAEDAEFGTRLEKEYVREDEDQFNGLFVKNLENVQGDERDIILLSICYAPGPDGRMLMNFGPINQRGGEKRLNVIFSRARHRMAVVSTVQADAIKNTHNDGAAALKAFLQFAEAAAGGDVDRSQAVLGSLNPGAQKAFGAPPSKDAFRSALAAALRQRGHSVDEMVGRSTFRCDLAIRRPDGDGYALALLLDSDRAAGADTREKHVFRPSVLRAFGWRVLDLPSGDWLLDSRGVLARIEAELKRQDGDPDPDEDAGEYTVTREPVLDEPAEAEEAEGAAALPEGFSEFLFQQGTSNKFWRIGRNNTDVTVVFGRVGTKGQTVIKSFDTPERAAREVAKLTLEKVNKGYVEVSRPA